MQQDRGHQYHQIYDGDTISSHGDRRTSRVLYVSWQLLIKFDKIVEIVHSGHNHMEVRGVGVIAEFQRKHPNARKPLNEWLAKVEAAQWSTLADMKKTFNSVDYVAPFYVFDVGGNNFRVIAVITFTGKTVTVDKVMTHGEYDRWKPK